MGFFSRLFRQPRVITAEPPDRQVRGGYDAARGGNETVNLWRLASSLDADACNSLGVRRKLRNNSREEQSNNGYCAGIVSTQSNYVIGTGPKLRLLTRSTPFNQMVEARWAAWCKATHFALKLRTMCSAKTGDGEGVGILFDNPNATDPVSLDLRLVECDQLTAPVMRTNDANYIDGVHFDEFGNPTDYDILKRHPGSTWYAAIVRPEYDTVPAKFVLHWFARKRAGQHRGVPDLAPSLSLFGTSRRYREAVVAAAETAADFAAIMEMGSAGISDDLVAPFTSIPIEKRMLMMSPAGATARQMKAEQPATTYESFNRGMISEEARPLNMPYNIAACDSSRYTFSGGQLDHLTYFVSVGVERQDCGFMVLDKTFPMWFEQAAHIYGWHVDATPAPKHTWGWNKKPQNDPVKTANARKISVGFGGTLLSDIYDEDGEDYDDKIERMADGYGVTVEEMKAALFEATFKRSPAAPGQGESGKQPTEASANGNGHANRFAGASA